MIKDRKGGATIVVLISILVMTMIMPTILMNPIQVKRKEKHMEKDLRNIKDLSQINIYITKDIIDNDYMIKESSTTSLQIGENNYSFIKGVKRNNIQISESECSFTINDRYLEVSCGDQLLLFSLIPNTNSIKEVVI